MRSGYVGISIDVGRLRDAGIVGYGWPSTAGYYTSVTDARAYYLGFSATDVYPSSNSDRWYGFSLRCLAD